MPRVSHSSANWFKRSRVRRECAWRRDEWLISGNIGPIENRKLFAPVEKRVHQDRAPPLTIRISPPYIIGEGGAEEPARVRRRLLRRSRRGFGEGNGAFTFASMAACWIPGL